MGVSAFMVGTWSTGTGTASGSNLTNNSYVALQGGTSTQVNWVEEVYIGGQAMASAPMILLLGRDSTVGAGTAALAAPNTNGLLNPSGAVITSIAVAFISATTVAVRS